MSRFESSINGIIKKKVADCGNGDTPPFERLCVQAGLLDDINVECSCDEKDEDAPEEVLPAKKKSTLELSRPFHSVESTKDTILEADSNLGIGQCSRASKKTKQKNAFPVS